MANRISLKVGELRALQAYRRVFATDDGRRVLADLVKASGLMTGAHVEGDSHATHVNIGKQWMVQRVLGFLKMTPDELTQLEKEMSNGR